MLRGHWRSLEITKLKVTLSLYRSTYIGPLGSPAIGKEHGFTNTNIIILKKPMSISETWQVLDFPRVENGYGSLNLGNLVPVLSGHVVLVVGGVSRATSLLHGSAGPGREHSPGSSSTPHQVTAAQHQPCTMGSSVRIG